MLKPAPKTAEYSIGKRPSSVHMIRTNYWQHEEGLVVVHSQSFSPIERYIVVIEYFLLLEWLFSKDVITLLPVVRSLYCHLGARLYLVHLHVHMHDMIVWISSMLCVDFSNYLAPAAKWLISHMLQPSSDSKWKLRTCWTSELTTLPLTSLIIPFLARHTG